MNPFSVLGRLVVLVVYAVVSLFAFAFAVPPGAVAVVGGGRSLVLAAGAGRPMLAGGLRSAHAEQLRPLEAGGDPPRRKPGPAGRVQLSIKPKPRARKRR